MSSFDEDLFLKGLEQRKATLGADYVEKNLAASDDFTRPFQEAMTAWCWGFGWGDDVGEQYTNYLNQRFANDGSSTSVAWNGVDTDWQDKNLQTGLVEDYGLTFSYARSLPIDGLNYGINAKVIRRIIGDFASSWGFGLDAGIQFETNNDWKFGLMARDITTTFNAWAIDEDEFSKIRDAVEGQNQELPETTEITKPKLQLGVAKDFKIGRFFNLQSEFDLNIRFEQTNDIFSSEIASIDPALGLQLDYEKLVYLRLGVGNFQYTTEFDNSKSLSTQPNLGVGFNYKGIQVDYALTNIGSVGNALFSNIFSITFDYTFFRR